MKAILPRLVIAALWVATLLHAANAAPAHPLDPLTGNELIAVRDILAASGQFSNETSFAWVQLDEPPKSFVQSYREGSPFPRRAYVAAIDYKAGKTFRVIVDIKENRVAELTDLNGLQPGIIARDADLATMIVNADPTIRAALVARGIRIPGMISDAIRLQFMSFGHDSAYDSQNARLIRVLFSSDQDAVNDFSPFLDGMMALVDLYSKKVINLYDSPQVRSVKVPHDVFDPKIVPPTATTELPSAARSNSKDLVIDGQTVVWKNWNFRFGFNLREGLVLYQVAFDDGLRKRPILYRASIAEVVTSYEDVSQFWSWMEFFDEGSFGLGYSSTTVRAGFEVPANAATIAALLPDPSEPRFYNVQDDRIYLYERDAGNTMYYQQGRRTISTRSTELVVGFLSSLGNYNFAFNWVFRQDGSLVFEVDMGGQILTRFVRSKTCEVCKESAESNLGREATFPQSGDEQYGALVYPNVVGVNHQHWFNLRLDFDIDGMRNSVLETNKYRAAGAMSDKGLAVDHTLFSRAVDAKRSMDDHTSRTWTIFNTHSLSRAGRPAGYAVVPMENAETTYSDSRQAETVGFTFHHFWVTAYRDDQLYAAGPYPYQPPKGYNDTLYHYANNDSIRDEDIVVWYTLGYTHVPRPEDYPLMSNMKLSVLFRPSGFFERNPLTGPR